MEVLTVIPKPGEGIAEAIQRTIEEKASQKPCPNEELLKLALAKIEELENKMRLQDIVLYALALICKGKMKEAAKEEISKNEV